MIVEEFKKYRTKPLLATTFVPIAIYIALLLHKLALKDGVIVEGMQEYATYTLIVYTFVFSVTILNKLLTDFKERIIIKEGSVLYIDMFDKIELTKTNSTPISKTRDFHIYKVTENGVVVHINIDEYSKELRTQLEKTLG